MNTSEKKKNTTCYVEQKDLFSTIVALGFLQYFSNIENRKQAISGIIRMINFNGQIDL